VLKFHCRAVYGHPYNEIKKSINGKKIAGEAAPGLLLH
jgi:hypothetical protein